MSYFDNQLPEENNIEIRFVMCLFKIPDKSNYIILNFKMKIQIHELFLDYIDYDNEIINAESFFIDPMINKSYQPPLHF